MKAIHSSSFTSLVFKVVGSLLILSFLLDVVVLLSTARFQDNQWLLTFTTQLIDRGFVALVGIALLFGGFWFQKEMAAANSGTQSSQEMRLIVLILSSFLGLMFLLLIPLNINSTRLAVDNQIQRLTQEAAQAESQIDAQVQQAKGQIDAQLAALDQAIKTGEFQGNRLGQADIAQAQKQRDELQKLKSDPKALEARIGPEQKRALDQIRNRKQEEETKLQDNALRSGMRSGLNSLLLAIGFILIGWNGLRQTLSRE